ncbi:MAG TPA: CARDB domain-containing protein, partial [Candidatus Paceibacterota bacterium]|nr:CARDB domain-containing protein [Candidatus Paceibacterota bacterium]
MKKIIGFSLLATAVVFCLACRLIEAQTTDSTTLTVTSTTQTTAGQIDLSISASDMKITPTTYASGDKITLSAKVVNLGNTKATNVKVDFYFGNAKVYTKTLTSLSAKSKTTVSYQYTVPTDFVGSTIFR